MDNLRKIGTKIYYCKKTGNVLLKIDDRMGFVKETTFDEDYETYKELNERKKDTIDLLKYEYGVFFNLCKDNNFFHYDLEKKELVFKKVDIEEEPKLTEIDLLKKKLLEMESIINEQDQVITDNAYDLALMKVNEQ